jgi:hypothetical protein
MLLIMVIRWRGIAPPLSGVLVRDQEKAAEGKDHAAIGLGCESFSAYG